MHGRKLIREIAFICFNLDNSIKIYLVLVCIHRAQHVANTTYFRSERFVWREEIVLFVAEVLGVNIIHFAVQSRWTFALDSSLLIVLDYDSFTLKFFYELLVWHLNEHVIVYFMGTSAFQFSSYFLVNIFLIFLIYHTIFVIGDSILIENVLNFFLLVLNLVGCLLFYRWILGKIFIRLVCIGLII